MAGRREDCGSGVSPDVGEKTPNPDSERKKLANIRADHGFQPHKLRDLHFDVLIALTARSHGARLITTNRTDFELINRYREINLEVW
jgi:predicted nucleic acid-binding protein